MTLIYNYTNVKSVVYVIFKMEVLRFASAVGTGLNALTVRSLVWRPA